MSLMEAGPNVLVPLMAGVLMPFIGLNGILLIDVLTFFLALGTLLIIFVPQPPRTQEGAAAQGSMLKEAWFGFKYIFDRPSLLGLQIIFFIGNLFTGMAFTLLAPMILARTDQNTLIFGSVQTAGVIVGVVGGIISVWGGFKRRVHGVLIGWMLSGTNQCHDPGLGHSAGDLDDWQCARGAVIPLVNASNQSIWQAKVAPDLQGRVSHPGA